MFSFCDTAEYCAYVIASRLAVVLSFMLAGVLLNGTILWIHQRNKTLPGRLYIVMLAVLDVYGSVCLLSAAALWELRVISNPPFFHQVIFQKTSYLFVQLAMLFDRIFAVFAPFKYRKRRQLSNMIILVLGLTIQAYTQVNIVFKPGVSYVVILSCFVMTFLLMLIAYPAIALRLLRQNKKIAKQPDAAATTTRRQRSCVTVMNVGSNPPNRNDCPIGVYISRNDDPISNISVSRNIIEPNNISVLNADETSNVHAPGYNNLGSNIPTNRISNAIGTRAATRVSNVSRIDRDDTRISNASSKRHMKVLKMFVGVLMLYVFANAGSFIVTLFDLKYFTYLYHLQSIGNFFVYFKFNDKFRHEVNALWKRAKGKCGRG